MVLQPLEFSDCLLHHPWFRQNLHEHEQALDESRKMIKNVENQCRELIDCTKKLSSAHKAFAKTLCEFKLETVGSTQTDDERAINNCLKDFGRRIKEIEDHRAKLIEDAEQVYIEPLRKFRVEKIGKGISEEKKKYEKESQRFYASLEKYLHLSTVRKNDFREADAQLGLQQRNFGDASLQYVAEIQSVQERMKFELVETLGSFLYSWLAFYHIGHVIHEDFKPFLDSVQGKVQKAKDNFKQTQEETEELKKKMLNSFIRNAVFPSSSANSSNSNNGGFITELALSKQTNSNIKQGYVYMQEKSKIPKGIGRDVLSRTWTKYYCVYSKETRIFTMIPVNSTAKTDIKVRALDQSISFKLKTCTRRASDSIDKRFCFDLVAEERPEVMTFQALSEEDRRQWLDAMDGREPVYSPGTGPHSAGAFETILDETGFEFVKDCIRSIESRGISEQGLYRNCGVTSKVQKLMQLALDKKKFNSNSSSSKDKLNLISDDSEWEIKTISSAVKTFLRNLPEPLMTFDLHAHFINAAKMNNANQRVDHIHYFVYKLPESHRKMLRLIISHLRKVADKADENLMTVGNLGVCFGPTLLRPKEETMAAIMDIKFCNVVVEVLIGNCHQIFETQPPLSLDLCPPKPSHNMVQISPPATTESSQLIGPNNANNTVSKGTINNNRLRHKQPPQTLTVIYDSPSGKRSETQSAEDLSSTTNSKNSTDSLNSSGSEKSNGLISQKTSPLASSTTNGPNNPLQPKTKSTASYAPLYNPQASETLSYQLKKRHSGNFSSLLSSSFHHVTVYPSSSLNQTYYNTLSSVPYTNQNAQGSGHNLNKCSIISTSTSIPNNVAALGHQSNPFSERQPPYFASLINPNAHMQASRRVKTLYECSAGHETELSFAPGQIITNVYESKEEGWLVGTLNGKTGLIPANYIEPLP